jgi:hypothetical protein
MNFKDIIQADLATFLNINEFADLHNIVLETVTYSIPTIVQDQLTDKYEKDYDGAYNSIINIIFRASDVARPPIYNQTVDFDGTTYWVLKSDVIDGLATVKLGVPET